MPIADSLNPNFSLPDMGDYYYDAPDQQRFYSEMDNILNPLHKLDLNQGAVSKFYCCTPPALGAKNETYTFSVTLQGGGVNADSEYVRGIRVDDGDTISVPLAYISGGDDESKKYLDQIAADAKAISAITGGADVSKAKLTLRFAGIDCKELPHFTKAGTDEVTSKEEVFYIEDALKDGQFVCSKYKSFMDDPEYNENPEGGVPIGKFYHYSREMKQANFVKMVDGCWHQYFGMGDDMYVLRKCDCNSYDESVIEDAGVARDVVANAIAAASEMRIQVDGAKLSKNAQIIHTKFGTKPYDDSPANTAKKFLDMFFDDYTEFTNAGFNCFGLDAYGRAIAVVYLCIGGKWINLNKMVVADTNDTEVNKYAAARDGAIDTSSFDFDAAQYADSLYKQSKEFDDRDEVQGEIFKTLGKGASLQALSDWTVIIGDVALMVPPTSIRCLTQSKSEHLPVLRAKGTMAKSATKMQRIIEMDIYFNGDNGINGYKYAIDLTPALVGRMCVPVLNLDACMDVDNVNMITCGGQATVPLASAINSVHPEATKYIEIVAAISSKSAGPGTRANIDEFTQTTGDALAQFTQTEKTKAIIILNSAEPPVHMHNTIYAIIDHPDMPAIIHAVRDMERKIQRYVPGYHLLYDPVYENGRVTTSLEVVGQGDYLPKYAGNLDIITCAAIEVAEHYAQKLLRERGELA